MRKKSYYLSAELLLRTIAIRHVVFSSGKRGNPFPTSLRGYRIYVGANEKPIHGVIRFLQRTIRETHGSSQLFYWLSRILQPSTLTERKKEREIVSIQ